VGGGSTIPRDNGYVLSSVCLTATVYSGSATLTEVRALLSTILVLWIVGRPGLCATRRRCSENLRTRQFAVFFCTPAYWRQTADERFGDPQALPGSQSFVGKAKKKGHQEDRVQCSVKYSQLL